MVPLAADEDFDNDIVRGLRRRDPGINLVTVQEAGLDGSPDPDVLEWAAAEGRVLVSHDVNTMVGHAWERVKAGQTMPGLIVRRREVPIRQAIDDLLLIAQCGIADDFRDQVWYLPLS
jgi:Domain of unknown function (DUF5615)